MRQEYNHRKKIARDNAIDWDEDKTRFAKTLVIKGKSFQKVADRYKLFDVPKVMTSFSGDNPSKHVLDSLSFSPDKNYAYAHRVLPAYTCLELMQNTRIGSIFFDHDVQIPVLFHYRPERSYDKLTVWMSITPMECLTQRQGVRLATGKVLIGGLGLGWLLRKVSEKKSVKEILVVEISQELIDWYGKELCERIQAETGTEIQLICDDVTNHIGEHGYETRYLLDIWSSYPVWDTDITPGLREKLKTVKWWGWGYTMAQY